MTFGAASVKMGGIRYLYYTFRRSNAPSPEESVVRVAQEVVGVPHVDESDPVGGKLNGEESQPTSYVDKLTNDGDSCLPPLRSITESPRRITIERPRLARTTT